MTIKPHYFYLIVTYSGAQKILKEALENGAAGSGKTTLKYCLFKSLLAFVAILHLQKLLFEISQR